VINGVACAVLIAMIACPIWCLWWYPRWTERAHAALDTRAYPTCALVRETLGSPIVRGCDDELGPGLRLYSHDAPADCIEVLWYPAPLTPLVPEVYAWVCDRDGGVIRSAQFASW
jgi:hypothetical protein